MAKPRRAKRAAAAATDAASDVKKQKQIVFHISVTVVAPDDVSPVPLEFDNQHKSKRAARHAKDKATRVERYGYHDFSKFATPFAAAIASASAKKGRPVTLVEAITEMTDMTDCEPKFVHKKWKEKFCRDGFARELWQISRDVPPQGLVPFPKGSSIPRGYDPSKWKFSPSPAARRSLANLSK